MGMSKITPLLFAALLTAIYIPNSGPAQGLAQSPSIDGPREGVEMNIPPKPVLPSSSARQRAIHAMKVETAWALSSGLEPASEAEAGS